MHRLIQEFERWYDLVIFDSPPLNLVTDAALLGVKAGGFVLNDFVFQRDCRSRGGMGYDYYGYRGAAYAERYADAADSSGDETGWRGRIKRLFKAQAEFLDYGCATSDGVPRQGPPRIR